MEEGSTTEALFHPGTSFTEGSHFGKSLDLEAAKKNMDRWHDIFLYTYALGIYAFGISLYTITVSILQNCMFAFLPSLRRLTACQKAQLIPKKKKKKNYIQNSDKMFEMYWNVVLNSEKILQTCKSPIWILNDGGFDLLFTWHLTWHLRPRPSTTILSITHCSFTIGYL